MKNTEETKEQLIKELEKLRKQLSVCKLSGNECKDLLDKLKESEEKYRMIFESANDVIFAINKSGKILDVNEKLKELTGYEKEELIGLNIRKLTKMVTPKSLATIVKNFMRRMVGINTPPYEVQILRKNGELANAEINAVAIKKDGKIMGDLAVVRDITERKRAEEELRKSEKRFRDISDAALTWVWEVDAKGKYIYVSPIVKKILGYTPKEILGRHFYDLFSREERQALKKAAFEVFAKKQPFREFINRNVHKNGHIVWLSTTAVPILNEKGDLLGYRGADADITERKFVEEALRESEEKYRAAVEQSADNIYLLDAETKRILESNTALQKLLEYSAEEMRKLTVYDIVAHSKEDINQKIKKIIKVKRAFIGEREYRRKDGSIVNVEVSVNCITLKGKEVFFVVSRVITDRKRAEEALRESEEKYKTLTENINVGIYRNTVGPKGKFIEANPAVVKIFGYDNKYEFFKINVADLYQRPRDRARFNQKILKHGFVRNEELQLKKKDDLPIICSVSAVAVKDEHGEVKFYDGIVEDITERKQDEAALLESEQKFRGLFESVRDGIIMVDMNGNIIDCNQSFLDMLGYTHKEIKKLTYQQVTPIRWHKYEDSIVRKQVLKRDFSDEYEIEFIKKGGAKRAVTVTKWVIRDEQRRPVGMWAIVRDITERIRHEEELEYMATHDVLTGLPNRMLFKDRLEQALKQAQRKGQKLAVMLLDLDRFKEINDSLGHSVGDQLLQRIGERLARVLRKGDTVARMGGDEFMLLLSEIMQIDDSSTIAQKVLIAIRTPLQVEQHELHITTSIGIAVYPLDGQDADTLMKNADIAMYWAKDKGRNDYQRYNQAMDTKKNLK